MVFESLSIGLILVISGFFLSFCTALYAHARVRANEKTLEALDWETLANLTGEVGAMKRSLQKVNNRINGMHSPKLQEQELMMQLLKNAPNQMVNGEA